MHAVNVLSVSALLVGLASSCNATNVPLPTCAFLPGDLVITEIMADPDGVDAGKEWFELYNATAGQLDLAGLTLEVVSGRGSKVHMIRAVDAPGIPAAGYLALGDGLVGPNHVNYSYGTALGSLPNEAGTIIVRCGSVEVDRVEYGGTAGPGAPSSGRSLQLAGAQIPGLYANDVPAMWCDATAPMDDGVDLGTPGAPNTPCAGADCPDGVGGFRPLRLPLPGELVLSEIMADVPGVEDHAREWLEVYNASAEAIDLLGLEVLYGAYCQLAAPLAGIGCLTIAPGSYAVLAGSADPAVNGGVTALAVFDGAGLLNDDGCVALRVAATEVDIDGAIYGTSVDGRAFSLDPGQLDATANDDLASWCVAATPYGDVGGFGTPGAPNPACGDTLCNDGGTPRATVAPGIGTLFTSEVFPNPTGVDTHAREWLELYVTEACDLNGLHITNGNGTNTRSWTLDSADCLHATAGTYVVIAGSMDPAQNGGLPTTDIIEVAGLSLYNSGTPLTMTLEVGGQVIDTATLPTPPEGKSVSLSPGQMTAAGNDAAGSFCMATTMTVFSGAGTPGQANDSCPGSG
jgi:hypothetical protein